MVRHQYIIFFLFIVNVAYSQPEKSLNNPTYDNQIYHFGFTLGMSNTKFHIDYTDFFIDERDFEQILSKYSPGFNVGIIMDVKINKNTNIRLTPSFNFTDQKIYFINNNIANIQPKSNHGVSNFELPLYIKYRSDRINNGRAYILLGGNFMLDMNSTSSLNQIQSLEFKKTNYSIDIGFGIDIYFAYFKFSPEIKYSYGIKNMLMTQENNYNYPINRLTTRGLLISLTFE